MPLILRYANFLNPKHSLIYYNSRKLSNERKLLKLIFYGTDNFSVKSLQKFISNIRLERNDHDRIIDSLHVVSKDGSFVSEVAKREGLPLTNWPDTHLDDSFDVGAVVSFGHLIPESSIKRCKYGILNVHGSLLPRWRGASPIHHAILAGDKVTGITIMRISPEAFDVGNIIAQQEYLIPKRATTSSVYNDLSVIGADLLFEIFRTIPLCFSRERPQPQEGVTKASKPKKQEGYLDFTKITSIEADRKVRALQGLVDVYSLWINGKPVQLFDPIDPEDLEDAKIDDIVQEESIPPGSIFYHKKRKILCFKCCDGRWIAFMSLQLKGYKRMSATAFFNGFVNSLIRNNCQPDVIKTTRSFRKV